MLGWYSVNGGSTVIKQRLKKTERNVRESSLKVKTCEISLLLVVVAEMAVDPDGSTVSDGVILGGAMRKEQLYTSSNT